MILYPLVPAWQGVQDAYGKFYNHVKPTGASTPAYDRAYNAAYKKEYDRAYNAAYKKASGGKSPPMGTTEMIALAAVAALGLAVMMKK